MDEKTCLEPLQFYHWRLSVEKLMHAKTKKTLTEHKIALLKKDIEIAKLKMNVLATELRSDEDVQNAEREYNQIKSYLENEIGLSLNGCSIDEETFAINQLPDEGV